MPHADNPPKPSWKRRRRVLTGAMIFATTVILYVMFTGEDSRLNETLVLGAYGMWVAVIGFYTGFATLEDIKLKRPPRDREEDNSYESI